MRRSSIYFKNAIDKTIARSYLLKNFFREQPADTGHFLELLDKLDSMLAADFADQVDPVPVVPAVLAQLHHTGQERSRTIPGSAPGYF